MRPTSIVALSLLAVLLLDAGTTSVDCLTAGSCAAAAGSYRYLQQIAIDKDSRDGTTTASASSK
jgi:hypothetical protein